MEVETTSLYSDIITVPFYDLLSTDTLLQKCNESQDMRKACGSYIRDNCFLTQSLGLVGNHLYHTQRTNTNIKNDICIRYVKKLKVSSSAVCLATSKRDRLKCIPQNFKSLICLELNNFHFFTVYDVRGLRCILNKVEKLKLKWSDKFGPFFAHFAVFCENLKSLHVNGCSGGVLVFKQMFPKLEHFCYRAVLPCSPLASCSEEYIVDDLQFFLRANRKLQHFECSWLFLWMNLEAFLESRAHLEELSLRFHNVRGLDVSKFVGFFFNGIIKLYKCDFFTSLNVSFDEYEVPYPMGNLNFLLTLSKVVSVKKIIFRWFVDFPVWFFDDKLTTIEHVRLLHPTISTICSFLTLVPNLKELFVYGFHDYVFDISLGDLNDKRKQLIGACCVSLYLTEEMYLHVMLNKTCESLDYIKVMRYKRAP